MKAAKGMKFKNIDLMATDPNKEQFAPTPAQPIRQRARMAGDPLGGYPDAEASPGAQFREKVQKANAAPADRRAVAEAVRTINDSTQGPGNVTARNYNKAMKQ